MPNTQNSWTPRLRNSSVLDPRQYVEASAAPHMPTIVLVNRSSKIPDIAELLRQMGYRVIPGQAAPSCVDDMRSANPDIFLYATDSADRATWNTLQTIRSDSALPFVPIILYVHSISPSDRRRARFLNVADCLTMPFDTQDLAAAISNAVSREQALHRQRQLFEDQLRFQILGLVQHEFRTPLTFLMGYAEYLRDAIGKDPDPDEVRLSLEGILEGSHRLHYLIESMILLTDLLQRDISREEICPIEPMDLWREAVNTLSAANADELEMVSLASTEKAYQVVGAPELIFEALVRLLDTVLRQHTRRNRRIRLALASSADMLGWSVHTEGHNPRSPNTRDRNEPQIVHPFLIGDPEHPLYDTLGLGLAVVEQVARMHGGRVTHETVAGNGAVLTMWLPLTPLPHLRPNLT